MVRDHGGDLLPSKWLGQDVAEVRNITLFLVVALESMTRNQDARRHRVAALADLADQIDTVEVRHVVVGYQNTDIDRV